MSERFTGFLRISSIPRYKMYVLEVSLSIFYAPLSSLELVCDVLEQSCQLNGVLLEDVATKAGQAWCI